MDICQDRPPSISQSPNGARDHLPADCSSRFQESPRRRATRLSGTEERRHLPAPIPLNACLPGEDSRRRCLHSRRSTGEPPARFERSENRGSLWHPPRSRQGSAPKGAKRPFGQWGLGVPPPGDEKPLRDSPARRRSPGESSHLAKRGPRSVATKAGIMAERVGSSLDRL